ncbi:hypothetical protein BH11PLA2_BH11PLA2_49930 [soil metagenome]
MKVVEAIKVHLDTLTVEDRSNDLYDCKIQGKPRPCVILKETDNGYFLAIGLTSQNTPKSTPLGCFGSGPQVSFIRQGAGQIVEIHKKQITGHFTSYLDLLQEKIVRSIWSEHFRYGPS